MEVFYINHLNEKIDLNSNNIILQYQEFFDYSWDATMRNNKISGFTRLSATIPVTAAVTADTWTEYLIIANNFYQIIEKDVLAKVPGKLYVGEFYIVCYIAGDKKTDAFMGVPFQAKNLSIVTDYPHWCRDKTCSFYLNPDAIIDEQGRNEVAETVENVSTEPEYPWDYPYGYISKYKPAKKHFLRDYAYDYYKNHTVGRLDNDHFAESDFRMIVYGPCTHPEIRIGPNLYRVNTILYDSEYLVIDSRERTIVKYGRNGVQTNLFNARDKVFYVFQKIPAGKQTVRWNAQYSFDVILYQERSEPLWSIS